MTNSQRKKQIVFVESFFHIPSFKIAYALKKTKKYETILILLTKHDKKIFEKAFDKIYIFDLKFTLAPKELINFFKKIKSKKGKKFLKKIKKLNPYAFQIAGPNLVTLWFMHFLKNKVKIYYACDIWEPYKKKFSLKKDSGIMQYFYKFIEKKCFKMADGILHKGPPKELNLLSYKLNAPDLSFLPYCLDEWIYSPKKKKSKEIHTVYIGGPWISWEGHVSFLKVIEIITLQKIHFHLYCPYDIDMDVYKKIENTNKYFHLHKGENPENLNKKILKYDYGLLPDFIYDTNIVSPLFIKISIGNKLFSYIESGLPIISSKQFEFNTKIIEENKIGINIEYKDLKNLRKILEKQDYKQLQKNVKKAQEKFKLSKNIKKLERFYDKVVEVKKCNKT